MTVSESAGAEHHQNTQTGTGHNRLAALTADIRSRHARFQRNTLELAAEAIEIGHQLIEAKALLPHGNWLPWLSGHVSISPRTATRYMAIARSGREIGQVADLGLTAAANALSESVHAECIRGLRQNIWAAAREVGDQLAKLRAELKPEAFSRWLETSLGWAVSDAEQFIAAAATNEAPTDDLEWSLVALLSQSASGKTS